MSSLPAATELDPYLLCRIAEDQLQCALWRLAEGGQAVALFLTDQSAANYQQTADLEGEWKVVQPRKQALLNVLKGARAGGIRYAVLEPDGLQAKKLFDLDEVLARAAESQ